jgi:hypothetical protein
MKKIFPLLILTFSILFKVAGKEYFVSTQGNDLYTGTIDNPFKSLQKAIDLIQPGDTIFLRGGTYNEPATITINYGNNGTESAKKHIFAYNNETVILNFSLLVTADNNRGVHLFGNYWHFKNIIIENAGDNGMLLAGNYNIIENCIFRKNRDSGLQLSRRLSSLNNINDWPSYNLILYCESYDNADPDCEDADGFAPKLTCGVGNVFIGCISHHNIDDGYDLYTKGATGPIGAVTFINCVAHDNGILTDGSTSGNGDKNGFKLGGENISVNHVLRRCVAFNNGKHGFTYNKNLGAIEITNCTAYKNSQRNYSFEAGSSIFNNNLSYKSTSNDKIIGVDGGSNIWCVDKPIQPIVVTDADFISLVPGPNESPFINGFLYLKNESKLIDAGTIVKDISYSGKAPDIGAFESGVLPIIKKYLLSVSIENNRGGSIIIEPQKAFYDSGDIVKITAIPLNEWNFQTWNGDTISNVSTLNIVMNNNKKINAVFTTNKVSLTYSIKGSGYISISPELNLYTKGTIITLTASPSANYIFDRWEGDTVSSQNPLELTISKHTNIIANFHKIPTKEIILQFEENNCSLSGTIETEHAGYLGTGFADLTNAVGSKVEKAVEATDSVTCNLTIRYAHGKTDSRPMQLFINGSLEISQIDFPPTGSFTTWDSVSVNVKLKKGNNKLSFVAINSGGGPNLDQLRLTASSASLSPADCQSSDIIFAPSSLSAKYNNKQIILSWLDNSNNEAGFYLERKSDSENYITIATLSPNSVSFIDTNYLSGVTYTYRIKAFNSEGQTAYSNYFLIKAISKYSLNVSINPTEGGNITVNPSDGIYEQGTKVTITAINNADYDFCGFAGSVNSENKYIEISMDSDINIIASFRLISKINNNLAKSIELSVEPNPIANYGFISFTADKNDFVILSLINEVGIKSIIYKGYVNKNEIKKFYLSAKSYSPGLYFIELTTSDNKYTNKLIIR